MVRLKMNSYMYKREMERKSLEVSCVLDVGRQKISSNYKIILVVFASKNYFNHFLCFLHSREHIHLWNTTKIAIGKVFKGFKVPDLSITVKQWLEIRICY